MRHVLGVLGVIAAGVLLAVSAAMNYRFGYGLGQTEFDGQIYGAASAAADCLKALVPFFFFAAIKTRMWSQAVASAVVWSIVTAYSFTSCLGHAALNRFAGASERKVEVQTYHDLRADMTRAQEQLGWVPQHRPARTIQSDIDNAKNQRAWNFTNGCTDVTGRQGREFCQGYHGLSAERAAADEAGRLETHIAEIRAKLGQTHGGTVMSEADPQAAVLARILSLDVDKVQMAMTIFIALLLEIGSGFGMYIAFSQWRVYDSYGRPAPATGGIVTADATVRTALPAPASGEEQALATAGSPGEPAVEPATAAAAPIGLVSGQDAEPSKAEPSPVIANDNKAEAVDESLNEAELYYRDCVVNQRGASIATAEMYNDYRRWSRKRGVPPMNQKIFEEKFEGPLQHCGLQKETVGKRTRYLNVRLSSEVAKEEAKRSRPVTVRAA